MQCRLVHGLEDLDDPAAAYQVAAVATEALAEYCASGPSQDDLDAAILRLARIQQSKRTDPLINTEIAAARAGGAATGLEARIWAAIDLLSEPGQRERALELACGPCAAPAPKQPARAARPGGAPWPRSALSRSACPNPSCLAAAAVPAPLSAAPAGEPAPARPPGPPAAPRPPPAARLAQRPSPPPPHAAARQAHAGHQARQADRAHQTRAPSILNLNHRFKHPRTKACRTPSLPSTCDPPLHVIPEAGRSRSAAKRTVRRAPPEPRPSGPAPRACPDMAAADGA